MLYHRRSDDKFDFLGTCFAFRHRHRFLTAAHCIGQLSPNDLVIGSSFHIAHWPWQVTKVTPHNEADLAALEIDPAGTTAVAPFYSVAKNCQMGDDIGAIGFPEDTTAKGIVEPTARYFRGHVQRFMNHDSYRGYSYRAVELSVPAPAGLSGGAVFKIGHVNPLVGIVCENFESSTYLRSIEEIQENGNTYREQVQSVINYAVCVRLSHYEQWLDRVVGQELG